MSPLDTEAAGGRIDPAVVAAAPPAADAANDTPAAQAVADDVPAPDSGANFPAAAPFPIDALGPGLAGAAQAIQARTLAPLALCGQAVLAAAALATQAHADVLLPDGRPRPLSLALLSVASPGERLDAVEDLAFAAVHEEERRLYAAHAADRAAAAAERLAARATPRGGKDRRRPDTLPAKPRAASLVTADPTPRGLFRLLESGPSLGVADADGAVLAGRRGEASRRLAGALARLWRDGSIERGHGAGAAKLHGRRLSLHVAATPDDGLAGLMARDRAALAGRLLPVAPDSTMGTRFLDDKVAARVAATQPELQRFEHRITELLRAAPPEAAPRKLALTPDAAARWQAFANAVEADVTAAFAAIEALAATAAEQASRIAGVLSLYADGEATMIGAEAMDGAIALMRHYLGEARRVAAWPREWEEARLTQAVLDYLVERGLTVVHLAEIYRHGPRALRDAAAVRGALRRLEAFGHVAPIAGGAWIDGRQRREAWRLGPAPDAPAAKAAKAVQMPVASTSAAMAPGAANVPNDAADAPRVADVAEAAKTVQMPVASTSAAMAPGAANAPNDAADAPRDADVAEAAKAVQMPAASASAAMAPGAADVPHDAADAPRDADVADAAQAVPVPMTSASIVRSVAASGADDAPPPLSPAEKRIRRLVAKGVPRDWIEGVARLEAMAPLPEFKAGQWMAFAMICERLLEEHGVALHRAGWTAAEVFGCHPRAPWRRLDIAGLALFLLARPGAAIVEIRDDGVIYDTPVNRHGPYGPYWHTRPQQSGVAPWLAAPAPAVDAARSRMAS